MLGFRHAFPCLAARFRAVFDSDVRWSPKELSDYERAHQAHSKVVADFAQMQSVSEMEEKVRGRPFREALEAVAPGWQRSRTMWGDRNAQEKGSKMARNI